MNDICALCEHDYVDAKHVLYVIRVSRDWCIIFENLRDVWVYVKFEPPWQDTMIYYTNLTLNP